MTETPAVQPQAPAAPAPAPGNPRRTGGVVDLVRLIVTLAAVVSVATWGFLAFDIPWNIIVGIAAPLITVLVWALFVSPRPVVRTHVFAQAAIELLVYASATAAWWSLGQPWIGLAFGVVAISVGLTSGLRRFE